MSDKIRKLRFAGVNGMPLTKVSQATQGHTGQNSTQSARWAKPLCVPLGLGSYPSSPPKILHHNHKIICFFEAVQVVLARNQKETSEGRARGQS